MSSKSQPSLGNAAEKLKLTRMMPSLQMVPLPAEGAPAVAAAPIMAGAPLRKGAAPKRPYRLHSYLSDEAGVRLQKLVAEFKAKRGRRFGTPDVLEQALLALERELHKG